MAQLRIPDPLRRFPSLMDMYRLFKLLFWKLLRQREVSAINRAALRQRRSKALLRDPQTKTKDVNLEMPLFTNTILEALANRLR